MKIPLENIIFRGGRAGRCPPARAERNLSGSRELAKNDQQPPTGSEIISVRITHVGEKKKKEIKPEECPAEKRNTAR